MPGESAVGVDNDLPPGEPGISDRTADYEPAGRIDQEILPQRPGVVAVGRQHFAHDVAPQAVVKEVLATVLVLRGDQDFLNRDRLAICVPDRYLSLSVRA